MIVPQKKRDIWLARNTFASLGRDVGARQEITQSVGCGEGLSAVMERNDALKANVSKEIWNDSMLRRGERQ